MRRCTLLNTAVVTLIAMTLPLPAIAQTSTSYPVKPVRLMVGASAGGGTDIIARIHHRIVKGFRQNRATRRRVRPQSA